MAGVAKGMCSGRKFSRERRRMTEARVDQKKTCWWSERKLEGVKVVRVEKMRVVDAPLSGQEPRMRAVIKAVIQKIAIGEMLDADKA